MVANTRQHDGVQDEAQAKSDPERTEAGGTTADANRQAQLDTPPAASPNGRVGGVAVMLGVGVWCSPTVFALLLPEHLRDGFVLMWPAILLSTLFLFAWQMPSGTVGLASRVALFLSVASWAVAEVLVDPVQSWGAFDPYALPDELVWWCGAFAKLLVTAASLTLLPRAAPPRATRVMPLVGLLALAFSGVALWSPQPEASLQNIDAERIAQGEPVELGSDMELQFAQALDPVDGIPLLGTGVELSVSGTPPPRQYCIVPEGASIAEVTRGPVTALMFDGGELGACGYDNRTGEQILLRAHDGIEPLPHSTLVMLFLILTTSITLLSLVRLVITRRERQRILGGLPGTFVPDRGIVLAGGAILAVPGAPPRAGPVVVFDKGSAPAGYREPAASRAIAWIEGDRASLVHPLEVRIDTLAWLALAASLMTLAMALVAGRF